MEPNENKEACLQREIKEELGVQTTALKPFCKRRTRIGKDTILIHYYLCRIAHGKPQRLEVQDFRWIKPSRYTLYDLAPPDRRVLRKLSNLRAEEL
jgi:8-oxo-dGTP diphosphatase